MTTATTPAARPARPLPRGCAGGCGGVCEPPPDRIWLGEHRAWQPTIGTTKEMTTPQAVEAQG